MKLKPGIPVPQKPLLDTSSRFPIRIDSRQHRCGPGSGRLLPVLRTGSALLLMLLTVVGLIGCAGYHVGNQFLYRSDIRTVHIEMVQNDSYRRFLGQQLTEAIVKQIELTTPLTITEPSLADSFVEARLIQEEKRVLGSNFSDEPRELQINYRLQVKWIDRAGTPLMERQLVNINRANAFVPEGGQSMATSQRELIDRIARDIVSQMETPW